MLIQMDLWDKTMHIYKSNTLGQKTLQAGMVQIAI